MCGFAWQETSLSFLILSVFKTLHQCDHEILPLSELAQEEASRYRIGMAYRTLVVSWHWLQYVTVCKPDAAPLYTRSKSSFSKIFTVWAVWPEETKDVYYTQGRYSLA